MNARRNALNGLTSTTAHAGLWLDRYLRAQTVAGTEDGVGAKAALIEEACGMSPSPDYAVAFARRKRIFDESGAHVAVARARDRVVIGLGAGGVLETGIHLEHTWGVPVLPGSALKGIAAAAAHRLAEDASWHRGGDSFRHLFGTTDDRAAVIFHDAWAVPGAPRPMLEPDVMTVHHAAYYGGKDVPPADTDSPTPIAFVTTTGSFLVAVEGDPDWCDAALLLLRQGLAELGIGAKTTSGYGRLGLDYQSAEERRAEAERREHVEATRAREAAERLKPNNAAHQVAQELRSLSGAARTLYARAAIKKLTRGWLEQRREMPWVRELFEAAGEPIAK
ncbi:MAG: type III-B CRISPR module RAMP protein Cmr6 [Deltaproteobacteria bacterium]|nr:type III-B CRISPR module RAMP protein Cmr6 [Deltaproteobacteria bacterium]